MELALFHDGRKDTLMPVNDYPLCHTLLCSLSPELSLSSSLPLARDHTKLVSEVHKLHLGQLLGQHIRDLLICGNVLELHNSLLHHIANVLIFDLNMLGFIVKHRILREFDATLIITVYRGRPQLSTK